MLTRAWEPSLLQLPVLCSHRLSWHSCCPTTKPKASEPQGFRWTAKGSRVTRTSSVLPRAPVFLLRGNPNVLLCRQRQHPLLPVSSLRYPSLSSPARGQTHPPTCDSLLPVDVPHIHPPVYRLGRQASLRKEHHAVHRFLVRPCAAHFKRARAEGFRLALTAAPPAEPSQVQPVKDAVTGANDCARCIGGDTEACGAADLR